MAEAMPRNARLVGWLLAATALLFGYTLLRASRRTLWHDELATYRLASLPTFQDTWAAVASGLDQLPPYPYVLVRATLGLTGRPEVDLRLVPALAFLVAAWATLLFLWRRAPPLFAAAGAALLLLTPAYGLYATDARPYSLICAGSALALLAWQGTAGAGRERALALAGLFVSVAVAMASHYYSVFLLVPLAAGEWARTRTRRRLDLPVAAALLLPTLVLLPGLGNLVSAARSRYLAHFWARAHLMDIPATYVAFFGLLPLAAAPLVAAALAGVARGRVPGPRVLALPPAERVALAAGAALPLLVVLVTRVTTHVFTPRYVSTAIVPGVLVAAWTACRVARGSTRGGALLLAGTLAVFVFRERDFLRTNQGPAVVPLPSSAGGARAGLPIVLLDPNRFLDTLHYAAADLRARLVFVADPEGAVRESGSDTADLVFLDMRRFTPLRVVEHERFVAGNAAFLIWGSRPTHTVDRLLAEGWRVELLGRERGEPLFLASRP